ncbi:MAG: PQQ-binding-like beta-propeller repeat protein [Planctomycetaceae bacterium]
MLRPARMKFPVCLLLFAGAVCSATADDWPQWGGPHRDCVWHETGIVREFPTDGLLPRVWSAPVGEGYSGPAVANGRVYITDRIAAENQERVLCFDAETGKQLWSHSSDVRYTVSYPAGPRTTPVIHDGLCYTIGAEGHLFCFDAESGDVKWSKDFQRDFGTQLPTWGMTSSPIVDGDQLITLVGGSDDSLLVSFDRSSGRELWRALSDPAVGYSPPVIYEFGGRRQLILWHPSAVSSLDPNTGRMIWQHPWKIRYGLTAPMPRKQGNLLFMTAFYDGPLMLRVTDQDAEVVWKGQGSSELQTDGLHSIMPTPVVADDFIYGVCSYGQLRCLNTKDGSRIWETLEATGSGRWWNAFLIPNGDRCFLHNEQGDLIIAQLSGSGYREISRAKLVEPTRPVQRRMTIWSHPAFAMQSVFARNDRELVRVSLQAEAP